MMFRGLPFVIRPIASINATQNEIVSLSHFSVIDRLADHLFLINNPRNLLAIDSMPVMYAEVVWSKERVRKPGGEPA
jgi:hypothetical protein